MCLDGLQQLYYININQRACADGTGLWIQMKRNVFLQKTRKTLEKLKSMGKDLDCCICFQTKVSQVKKGSYFICSVCNLEIFTEKKNIHRIKEK